MCLLHRCISYSLSLSLQLFWREPIHGLLLLSFPFIPPQCRLFYCFASILILHSTFYIFPSFCFYNACMMWGPSRIARMSAEFWHGKQNIRTPLEHTLEQDLQAIKNEALCFILTCTFPPPPVSCLFLLLCFVGSLSFYQYFWLSLYHRPLTPATATVVGRLSSQGRLKIETDRTREAERDFAPLIGRK